MSTSEEDSSSLKHELQRAGTDRQTSSILPLGTGSTLPSSTVCCPQLGVTSPLEDPNHDLPHEHRSASPLPALVKSSSSTGDSPKSKIDHATVTGSDAQPEVPPISTKSHADVSVLPNFASAETRLGQSTCDPCTSPKPSTSPVKGTGESTKLRQRDCGLRAPSPPAPTDPVAGPSDSSSSRTVSQRVHLTSSLPRGVRVSRSAYAPSWAVPPRVLLVDDDAVNRTLSSKFLQIFGCTIDVAVDGFGAVDKMNVKKYDLVLMDIVMPGLDGLSATTMIRRFDSVTPIISMTSNSKPHEVLTYFSNGMNDILPKPFTKDGLLDMVEKHLVHLKFIRTMSPIPPSLDASPTNSPEPHDASSSTTQQPSSSSSTSISISFSYRKEDQIQSSQDQSHQDEEFANILQNLADRKRTLHSSPGDARSSRRKRSSADAEEAPSEKHPSKKRRSKHVESA